MSNETTSKGIRRELFSLLGMLGAFLLVIVLLPTTAQAQVPPEVVAFIDLKCYGITGPDGLPLPPLNVPLQLDHLNPLFQQMVPPLPPENVLVFDPVQLCVPVAKNGVVPPQEVLDFVRFLDLKCYNILDPTTGGPLPPLGLDLIVTHLNRVLIGLGAQPEFVTMFEPQKLCVPVAKNGVLPPPGSLAFDFVSFVDQKCYNIAGARLNLPLNLLHLNPVLRDRTDVPPTEDVFVADAQQLCVPVKKNQLPPPTPVVDAVSNLDLKCYAITDVFGGPLPPLGITLTLTHLNPVLRSMPTVPPDEFVVVQEPQQLCVPVSKSLPPPPAPAASARSSQRVLAGNGPLR